MQNWEYMIVQIDEAGFVSVINKYHTENYKLTHIKSNPLELQIEYLNRLGAEGWEVVSMTTGLEQTFLLKRSITVESQKIGISR